MMDSTEVRAPQLWRRPHAKIYGYNQDFSANYYSVSIQIQMGIRRESWEYKIYISFQLTI